MHKCVSNSGGKTNKTKFMSKCSNENSSEIECKVVEDDRRRGHVLHSNRIVPILWSWDGVEPPKTRGEHLRAILLASRDARLVTRVYPYTRFRHVKSNKGKKPFWCIAFASDDPHEGLGHPLQIGANSADREWPDAESCGTEVVWSLHYVGHCNHNC